jgi:hypothetical protein
VLFSGPYTAKRKSYIRYNIFDVSVLKKHASVAALTLVQPAFSTDRLVIVVGLSYSQQFAPIPHTFRKAHRKQMVFNSAKEVFIQGVTSTGKVFRPSDWAERLAGVMSSFRPGGAHPGDHLSYSPWCVPVLINGVRCVVVQAELRAEEPMAWDFVINFGLDNDLVISEACLLPDA